MTFDNLQGQVSGTLEIGQRERLRPLAWRTKCRVCGMANQIHSHTKLQNGTAECTNAQCGRTTAHTSGTSGGEVIAIPMGVRSGDSADFREYLRPIWHAEKARHEALERERAEDAARQAKRDAEHRVYVYKLTAEHKIFVRQALLVWGQPLDEVVSLKDWAKITPETRLEIFGRIKANPSDPLTITVS